MSMYKTSSCQLPCLYFVVFIISIKHCYFIFSDLEKYRDLSGSRTSLSGKIDSFRKAAKNKWSALRRAVSLERVDRAGTSDEASGGMGKLKKSPSLQSLAKKINSFRKKDKAKFSGIESTDMPRSNQASHRYVPSL